MRFLSVCLWLLASHAMAQSAPTSDRSAEIRTALREGGNYAATVLLDDAGRARGDYDQVRGVWLEYEPAWHTGQLIWGLLEAHKVTGDAALLSAARRGGNWWIAQQLQAPSPLAGMLNAAHGGRLGPLINFTTLSDGTPGLFELTRVTGDSRYADVATQAGNWSLKHLYLPREALLYNIVDPATAEVWKDRSPHHPDAKPAALNQVARPNVEGFLFLDMYRHQQDPAAKKAFINLIEGVVRRQSPSGFWMDFEPNDPASGKIHPRFNLWYAEALLEAYDATGEKRYLDAATRTARATVALQQSNGAIYYDNRLEGSPRERSLTGSAVAFAGLIWLRLRDAGVSGFDQPIERALDWLLTNRFPVNHPDPNLRGGFLETWVKTDGAHTQIQVRDIATAFALRFLAAYYQRCCSTAALVAPRAQPSTAVTRAPQPDASEFTPSESQPSALAVSASMDARMGVIPGHLPARNKIDLSGRWRYIVDPFDLGRRKPHAVRRNLPLDLVATPGGELIEYEWDTAAEIDVPADWNTAIPALNWYEGVLWYRRTFDAPAEPQRSVLYFEGANYRTEVWLNGQKLGVHDGGFTPFAFDVSAKLKPKGNSLVVAVDNERRADRIPALDFDWFNYGGITRPVHLLTLPTTAILDARLWLAESEGRAQLRATVRLDGAAAAGMPVSIAVSELGVEANANADADGIARFEIALPKTLKRWSPASPTLYQVQVSTRTDRISERIGLRTIAVKGGELLLNGKPLYLKGISVHEERFGADGGRPRTPQDIRALLTAVQELGSNFVRLAHYPHSETTTRLADELGLLVWSEIPVYWEEIGYANPAVYSLAEAMLASNVARDFNRASIITWSVANETPNTAARNAFLSTLIDRVRRDDPTRPISAALNKNLEIDRVVTVTDPLGAALDLIAINTYEGWYGKRTPAQIREVRYRSIYDKPLLFSEFGADALAGFIGTESERWSEAYQAALYRETLAEIADTPQARGISPWILKDFRSPRRFHGRYQNYWNRKGVVDENGQQKAAFAVLRKHYESSDK